jgi:hypothetical protein
MCYTCHFPKVANIYGDSYTSRILGKTGKRPLCITILLVKTLEPGTVMKFDVWVDRSDTVPGLRAAWQSVSLFRGSNPEEMNYHQPWLLLQVKS